MNLDLLEELGLSKGQVAVYRAVLEVGVTGLNGIQEKTGIERRNIYDILNKLIERGLVSYVVEKGHRKYRCTHPRHLKEKVVERQERLHSLENELSAIETLYSEHKLHIAAEVLRGVDAIKALFDEILEHPESRWLGGNSFQGYTVPADLQRWFKHWMDRRVKQQHMMYDLVDHGTFLKELPPDNPELLAKSFYKYAQLPEDLQSPMVVVIFGDKVVQILWSGQPFAFVLESPEIKDSYLRYFNFFWPDS